MAIPGKWIEGVKPSSNVCEVAQRSLQARLTVVQHQLPLAALSAHEDIEYVHRLRVATRRAVAALKLYKHFLPGRRSSDLKRKLNEIRRAAGAARDLDVLSERLGTDDGEPLDFLRDEIARRRAAAQMQIKQAYDAAMKEGALQQLTYQVLERVRPRRKRDKKPNQAVFGNWARRRQKQAAEKFFEARPVDSTDYEALHAFRVEGKNLRYVMELLAAAFAPDFRKELYPRVEQLQERLGRINDHFTAANQFDKWRNLAHSDDQHDLLDRLAGTERSRLRCGVAEFDRWWTEERAAELRAALTGETRPLSPRPGQNGAAGRSAEKQVT